MRWSRAVRRADPDSGRGLAAVVARHEGALVLRVLRRMRAIDGYDRALALSAQAFVALVPLIVVVSALLPAGVRESTGAAVVDGAGLPTDAAAALSLLVREPPGADATTVLGGVLLVMAVLGFTRALQRTYVSAYRLPRTGLRGWVHGLAAAGVLGVGLIALALVGSASAVLDGHLAVELVVHAVAATLLWWPVQSVLLGGRIAWRALLPGAALTGVGQAVVVAVSATYLPAALSREASRYGLLGVAVALLSWLVVLGLLLVLSAVLGAELAERP
ncbi:YhjD/YihY/BrkB family envelope integrity protein [Actinomycetospora atypica]|uniref:YhjD/YihY/BrkB family envelope integrity protein n=1 Tax=Actinomycetospora atypica TaxID=1290095 RepID=A0ABV9YP83_9PSEU